MIMSGDNGDNKEAKPSTTQAAEEEAKPFGNLKPEELPTEVKLYYYNPRKDKDKNNK